VGNRAISREIYGSERKMRKNNQLKLMSKTSVPTKEARPKAERICLQNKKNPEKRERGQGG